MTEQSQNNTDQGGWQGVNGQFLWNCAWSSLSTKKEKILIPVPPTHFNVEIKPVTKPAPAQKASTMTPDHFGPLAEAAIAKLAYDILGPSAKYIGVELKNYTQRSHESIAKVLGLALARIKALGKSHGQVAHRVARRILDDAISCEDEVQACYLGGILASAYGPSNRDDRAVAYCAIINSLSVYQIRTHFILYSAILNSPLYKPQDFLRLLRHRGVTACVLQADYEAAMEFSECEQRNVISEHSFVGLHENGLIQGDSRPANGYKESFLFFHPTLLGIELFLWGIGLGDKGADAFLPEAISDIQLPLQVRASDLQLDRINWH